MRALLALTSLALPLLAGCGEAHHVPFPDMPDAALDGAVTVDIGAADSGADVFDADGISDGMTDNMSDGTVDDIPDGMLVDDMNTPDLAPDAAPPPCARAIEATVDDAPVAEVAFAPTAARGPARSVAVTLSNRCARAVRFLGHPDDWIDDPRFDLETLPPIELAGGAQATIRLRFYPDEAGEAAARFALPYDAPGSPLELALDAPVLPARRVVFIGDGRHVVAVDDYGETVVHDSFETLVAHGDALQRGVAWGGGRYVAVGGNVDARWWVSPDGVEWTAYADPDAAVIFAVAHGGGRFVAGGRVPLTSVDGVEWTAGAGPAGREPGHLRNLVAIEDYFVAVGDGGRVAISYTGDGWDLDSSFGIAGGVTGAAHGNGRLVIVGSGAFAAVSVDRGATWETTAVPEAGDLGGLTFVDGHFYASDGQRVVRSADGLTWSTINGTGFGISAGYGRMLLGTSGNSIGRSDDGGFSWTTVYESPAGLPIGRAAVEGIR